MNRTLAQDPVRAFLNHGNVDNSSSRFGGVSHYEWVFARPWDGVDPSITVGSEVIAGRVFGAFCG